MAESSPVDRKTKQLVKQLESDDPKERYIAVAELAKNKVVGAYPLIDKLATLDPDKRVRDMAYKAVRMLNILRNQMEEEELRRQIMEVDALDDSDSSPRKSIFTADFEEDDEEVPISSIRNMAGLSSIFTDDADDEEASPASSAPQSYSPEELGIYQLDILDDDEDRTQKQRDDTSKKKQRSAKKENTRGTTFVYRMILWLSVSLAIIALGLVAEQELNDTSPDSRAEALEGLEEWHSELTDTATTYSIAVGASQFDCENFRNNERFDVPEAPEWAGPDEEYQENLDNFFSAMESAETDLRDLHRVIGTFCERIDSSAPLPASINAEAIIQGVVLRLNIAKQDIQPAQ